MGKCFSLDVHNIDILEINNGDFLKLSMDIISDHPNRNDSDFLLESFSSSIPTIYNKPILAYFNTQLNDTEEHNSKLMLGDDGEIYSDYQYNSAEKPVGVIPESAEISIIEHDGKHWVHIEGAVIWTEYNAQLVELIKRQLKKKVSVEIEALDSYMDGKIERIKLWKFYGVTILGKMPNGEEVQEGIEGAHLKMISENEEFKRYRKQLTFALNNATKPDILDKYIKNTKEEEKVIMALSHRELEDKLWAELSGYTYQDNDTTYHKYYIEDIYEDKHEIVVKDNETNDYCIIPYDISEDNKVHIDMTRKRDTQKKWESQDADTRIEVFVSKKDWGTGDTVKAVKSKESVSKDSWGSINKSELRNEVLKAKNYKNLVHDVYLLVQDDWESSPSKNLKYPVMQYKDGKFVYNANGLLSAQQYAEKYDESIAKKALTIRKRLGLVQGKKEENMKKFIELAKDSNFIYIGTINGKLRFVKEVEADDEDKDKKDMAVFEIDKIKCEKCEEKDEFAEDKLDVKHFEDDDDDDDDDEDTEKEEMKAKLRKADEKCVEMAKELKTLKEEKFKEDAAKVFEECKEEMAEEDKKEMKEWIDNPKDIDLTAFTKELAFRQFNYRTQQRNSDGGRLSFSILGNNQTNPKVDTKVDPLDLI